MAGGSFFQALPAAALRAAGALGISVAYMGLTRMQALATVRRAGSQSEWMNQVNDRFFDLIVGIVGFELFTAMLVGLCYQVYCGLMGKVSAEELRGDAVGFRAWFKPVNSAAALIMAAGAWVSMGWSFVGMLLLGAGLLAVVPLFLSLSRSGAMAREHAAAESGSESEERERILKLLEAGKINAEEAGDLLSALGQSRARAVPQAMAGTALGANRGVMLAGAALVLLGFMLPWYEVNVGSQLRDAMQAMPEAAGGIINGMQANIPVNVHVTLRGGDLQHGMGWIILACAVAAAGLGLVWPVRAENRMTQRGLTLALAAVGSALLVYILSGGLNGASVGIFAAAAGYVVLWAGIVREFILTPRVGVVAVAG